MQTSYWEMQTNRDSHVRVSLSLARGQPSLTRLPSSDASISGYSSRHSCPIPLVLCGFALSIITWINASVGLRYSLSGYNLTTPGGRWRCLFSLRSCSPTTASTTARCRDDEVIVIIRALANPFRPSFPLGRRCITAAACRRIA